MKWTRTLEKTWAYDIEVFAEDYMVCFFNGSEYKLFVNNIKGLKDFVYNNIIMAYNDSGYDKRVLSHILRTNGNHFEIKRLSDRIISTKKQDKWGQEYINKMYKIDYNIKSLDLMTEIVPDADEKTLSLKMIEANWGDSIIESEVDFNIDRKLTEEELESTIKYVKADCEAAWKLLQLRIDYFNNKHLLVEMALEHGRFEKPFHKNYWNLMNRTETSLVGVILENNVEFTCNVDDFDVPDEVKAFWKEELRQWRLSEETGVKKEKNTFSIMVGNLLFDFSSGGAHGVNILKNHFQSNYMFEPDVTSMYPTLLILFRLLGNKTPLYQELYDKKNVTYAKPKNDEEKQLRELFKLILNKTYGAHGNKYNKLYNKEVMLFICFKGQEILYNMAKLFDENGMELVQVNTDGVMAIDYYGKMEECCKMIEDKYNIELDIPKYNMIIQKDVNNYIAVGDGHEVIKGSIGNIDGSRWNKNNNEPILNKIVYEYFVNNKKPEQVVFDNKDNLQLFQYNCKISRAYDGVAFFNNFEEKKSPYRDYFMPLWKNRFKDDFEGVFNYISDNIMVINKSVENFNIRSCINFEVLEDIRKASDFCKELRKQLEVNTSLKLPEVLYHVSDRDYFIQENVLFESKGSVFRTFQVIPNEHTGLIRKKKIKEDLVTYDKFSVLGSNSFIYPYDIKDEHDLQLDYGYYIKRGYEEINKFKEKK